MEKTYVIGVDFGSDSARALIVDAESGAEIGAAVSAYPRWKAGLYQDAGRGMFRQHPLDYMESLTECVRGALTAAGEGAAERVAALSIDTTGSTPCPVGRDGMPLAMREEFAEEPDAMFQLWKDHTAIREAKEITAHFSNWKGVDYTRYQGPYASEWFWAKILHTVRTNARVREAAWTWVEHCDWLTSVLCGREKPETLYRCACAAGHKAYYHSAWGGLPERACLAALDEGLGQIYDTFGRVEGCQTAVGTITKEWAARLGLPETVLIGGCSFDAHAGAVGSGVRPGRTVVNIGTSAVDMLVVRAEDVPKAAFSHICGAAENSILPGYVGLECSQAAYGDAYAWLKRLLRYPLERMNLQGVVSEDVRAALLARMEQELFAGLQEDAERLPLEGAVTMLDWFNGRRYPQVNEAARAAAVALDLGTDAPKLYQALVIATAFGQRRIFEALRSVGIEPGKVVAVGGIAQKSRYVMQTLCDALGCEIAVSKTTQACARGAAIYAAVSAGLYADVCAAQDALCEGMLGCFQPDTAKKDAYDRLYARYLALADFADGMC